MFKMLLGAQALDTEKIISELKLPTFLNKCLDNCAGRQWAINPNLTQQNVIPKGKRAGT